MELFLKILLSGWVVLIMMAAFDAINKYESGNKMPDWYQMTAGLLVILFSIATFIYIQLRIWL